MNKAPIKQADRIALMAFRLGRGEHVTTASIRRDFKVSIATAKRDAALLDRVLLGRVPRPAGPQPPRHIRMLGEPRRVVRLLGMTE